MRLFEADVFEERIQSVENRAGRIAWKVMSGVLIFSMFGYMRIAPEPDKNVIFILLIPIIAAFVVYIWVRRQGGVTEKHLREEYLRLGRTADAKRIIHKRIFESTIWGMLFLLIAVPWENFSSNGIIVVTSAILLGIVISYLSTRQELYGRRKREMIDKESNQ